MTKNKPRFNPKERVIIQALNRSRAGMTAYEISKKTGISWITSKKYLKKLKAKKIVK